LDPPPNGALLFKWYNIIMARDHFAQANKNPRYGSRFYTHHESKESQSEQRIEFFLSRVINKFKGIFGRR
jgi:hypothetical protein